MAARARFDLLVVGADLAGFAAAAVAARRGAATAIAATGDEAPFEGDVAEPPNAVWRLLDLQQYDVRFEPTEPSLSLFEKGPLAIDEAITQTVDGSPNQYWPQFLSAMRRLSPSRDVDSLLSANALLDDYFDDEDLKTHLVSLHVAPLGLAGDEQGSAQALAAAGAAGTRRASAAALGDALQRAAAAAGAEIIPGRLQTLNRIDSKSLSAACDNGLEIRARAAMASSALIGEAFGARIDAGPTALLRRCGVAATIRMRLDRKPKAPGGRRNAVCHTALDRNAIIRARDAVIAGAIPDEPPLSFRLVGKEIVAQAPFCPSRIIENGEAREWTGQDRQVLGRAAASVIEKRLGGAVNAREIDISFGPDVEAGLARRNFEIPPLRAPAPGENAIGAAAALALELIGDD